MCQSTKAQVFKGLHERNEPLILANPWDAGSARLLASLGFEALATSSAGLAFSLGVRDTEGLLSREQILENAKAIVQATELPVSADLENGFADSPDAVARTIGLAAEAGLVGGSIEDGAGRKGQTVYDFNHAVERISAAAEAARALAFPFTLVARAENYSFGIQDLDDTIRRLQAFEKAGADVLYAPCLPDLQSIKTLCESVNKPVNVVMGLSGAAYSVAQLAEVGVRRISLGSSFARAALGGLLRAAQEVREQGTFNFARDAIAFKAMNDLMKG
ncbi:isocitrate lyase/phosphoenolpyruvate mutase family protein [Pseudomonas sp. 21LCFQ010]|uniref:isocitrate lyase/PEP mutase family protein n=1 Tax=Pseudomonas sp. 21LCFQ010 TaxID=2957506 RepID=UPI002096C228|nr:isocitrate lyase/phosphoenolpyruvate mutase family protein [Pseudomonas sp. 21LCFQ010]MCO8161235.1 isocitrate lyase/phosphoenolpyruvate mutase family protein [Pseudomonas sp. 21LCFQ010]